MRSIEERAARVRFRRALALMAMTLIAPGSAQLAAGDRRVGRIALRVWILVLTGGFLSLVVAVFWHELAFWAATTPSMLLALRLALIAAAVGWVYLFFDAWRISQPLTLALGHRRAAVSVTGVVALGMSAVLLFSAHLVGVQRGLVMAMFAGNSVSDAADGRYNVLLIGADSGVTRWGLRTDSMTVASIDAKTGKTVLIGLPRNMMNFPFPKGSILAKQWPHGYNCSTCELNSLSTYAADHKALFGSFDQPGVEATMEGIEGITGLKINYYAMINMPGFRDLADAIGGVTINVRQPIAIGKTGAVTGWIKPGVKKLTGEQLLWYSRSRATSDDYSRMARQKCVMNAMLHQVSPATVMKHFGKIAKASAALFTTDIPTSEVDHFAQLALKAKSQKISTLSLVPPLVNTSNPKIKTIRRAIDAAIAPAPKASAPKSTGAKGAAKKPSASTGTAPTKDVMTEGSYGSLKTGYVANQTDDLAGAC
ncbi:LCP family protein [Nocardioides sp. BP30]|uniref:LCP family protein n=1 Tax=Nocardioides sp. BP30 TaxID=3036374 RepID=UPI00246970F1|nr:LCP family protein [Nocardioides sp. BP30]WGL51526.1 LCP family protein [Nocardioides sp. BP30]